jgi:hypothetical protein
MRFSKSDHSFTRNQENKQYGTEICSGYEEYKRRVNNYCNNLIKDFAMIWERCTKSMKKKIEARKDFHSKFEDNPIELLKTIKEHIQKFQEHHYFCLLFWIHFKVYLIPSRRKENFCRTGPSIFGRKGRYLNPILVES